MNKTLLAILLSISYSTLASASSDQLFEKALASFQQGKLAEADIHIKNILKEDRLHINTRLLLAELLLANGNGGAAKVELDFVKSQGVDQNRLVLLFAESHLLERQYRTVIETANTGEFDGKTTSKLNYFVGQAYLGLQQLRSADQAFDEAIALDPSLQKAYLGKAQVAIIQKKYTLAMQHVDKALSLFEPSANAWLIKASLLQRVGKEGSSLDAINKAIEISDDNLLARLTRAAIYINKKDYALAQVDVDKIIDRIPNEPRANYLKALINAATNTLQPNENLLSEVITTLNAVPDDIMRTTPGYYYLAGLTNFEHGNLNDARRYLVEYLKYEATDIRAIRMIAIIDIEQGDNLAAINLLGKVNLQEPNNPNILSLLGLANQNIGHIEKAEFYFEQVAALAPDSSVPIANLAKTSMAKGDYESAIKGLLSIGDDVNPIEVKLLLIESYLKSKQFLKAKTIVTALLEQFPKNEFLLVKLGSILGLTGDIAGAKQNFEQALTIDKKNVQAIIHLTRIETLEQKYELAQARIDKALIELPNNINLLSEKARVFALNNQMEDALRWFEKAYSFDNNSVTTLTDLVQMQLSQGKNQAAIDILDEYIGRHNRNEKAYILLGDAQKLLNNNKQAILAYQEAAKNAANKGEAYIRLAQSQLLIADKTNAKRSLNKAIAWDEAYLPAYIELAKLVISDNDKDYALSLINTIEKLSPNTPINKVLEGELYIKLNDLKKAEDALVNAMNQQPNRRALLLLNEVQQATGQHAKALADLSVWLKNSPNDLLVELAFAATLQNNKQLEQAQRVFTALINKYPTSAIVFNNAANFHSILNENNEALTLALKANELSPKNPSIMDTIGWINHQLGEYEKALPYYRDALLIDYANPVIKYHLALALEKLDRKDEAMRQLISAVESGVDFKDKTVATRLLQTWQN